MARVAFRTVSKVYGDGTRAVQDLDLSVADGEFMVLVGPSGSGKTTALRMAAGLEEITSGEIEIGERVVNGIHARDRDIAMVFQNYALYPHMSAYDNIGFGLKLRRRKKPEIERKVRSASELLGLEDALVKKPRELSGGQRQRVAMGRAIVRQPQVFMMDEPLSNLDAQLRVQMRAEIRQLQRELGVTTLYVTHDQVEAMTLGDRVAVFREGVLQQVDSPARLYQRPTNIFVASFIGSPSMNLLGGHVLRADGELTVALGDARICLPQAGRNAPASLEAYVGRSIVVGIRPESLRPATPGSDDSSTLRARVELVELLGAESLVHASLAATSVAVTSRTRMIRVGEDRALIVARFPPGIHPDVGDAAELHVDAEDLRYFDGDTGVALVSPH